MQPNRALDRALDAGLRAMTMERVMVSVRRHWFGAREVPLGAATAVVEAGGEMLMCLNGDGAQADALVARAVERGAYVVATDFTRPADLSVRLRVAGMRPVQRHGAYVLEELPTEPAPAPRPGILGLLRLRPTAPLTVRVIDEAELPAWNEVCWEAFGRRGTLSDSLNEKRVAFRSMGDAARWYLALAGDRPVGTAIVYQAPEAAQVLAVGTLPAYRRRGAASALMTRLVRDWQQDGTGFLFLDTKPGGTAERLYLQLGFRPAYTREVWAPPGLRP